jgi:hypothetical protein
MTDKLLKQLERAIAKEDERSPAPSEAKLKADELLGAPSNAEVRAASAFVQQFEYTTTALLAIVAVLRGEFEEPEQAVLLESVCEDFAELEATSLEG